MIYADVECKECKHVSEHLMEYRDQPPCPKCGGKTRRIFTPSGAYLGNQDCAHVRSAVDILVDKDDKSPDAMQLRQHPTRNNLQQYLKSRGLSRMDWTEHGGPPGYRPPPEPDLYKLREEVARRHFERKSINVRS